MGYLKQYYQMLRAHLRQISEDNVRAIDNVLYTTRYDYPIRFSSFPSAEIDTTGIVLGSGSTTPTPTDYKLETLIAHGTGPGQLQYGAITVNSVSTTATKSRMSITRTFTNGSGASITTNEVGIYIEMHTGAVPLLKNFCIIRSLKNSTIPDGESRTVEILLEVTA